MLNKNLQDPTMPSYSYRLVAKVLLIVGFIIVGSIALINFFFLDRMAASNVKQIREMAGTTSVIVSDLALSSFYNRDKTQIIDSLDKVMREESNHESGLLQISVILFPSGVYYASTNKEFQNKKVGQTLLAKIEKNSEEQTVSELLNYEVNNRTTTVLQFLRNIQVKKEGEDKRIATVQVLFDYNRILKRSRETLFFWGLLVLLLCFALVGALFLPISSVYTRLYEGMEEVARNRFGFELPSKTRDETGILFKTFNRMNRHLLADFKKGKEAHLESLRDEDPDKAGLSEHLLRKTEITCLCARIPDIQNVIEKNTPTAVDDYINGFIEPLEKKVQEYGGQIVKVLGDKVYTLFEGINSIDNSVRMALKVNQSWQIDNHERKVLDRKQRNYGIGLHSTEGIAGALSRMSSASYTFIGEAASAAERLCSCAQAEEILISSSMMDKTTGAYQHQLAKTLSAEDLTMKEDVISITPLPIDEMHTRSATKSGAAENGAESQFMTGKAKPSFESSITDMLEETLITSPLDPLKTDGRSGAGMNDHLGDMGITGEQFGDVSDSLWEKFDSIKKDDKE